MVSRVTAFAFELVHAGKEIEFSGGARGVRIPLDIDGDSPPWHRARRMGASRDRHCEPGNDASDSNLSVPNSTAPW
jgi:hypothetical protein